MKQALFATTFEKTGEWLDEVMVRLHWNDPRHAWAALRAVLAVLRDRLTVEEAAALGAQLPMLVRGAYYEGWHPAGKPLRLRHTADFYERVVRELGPHADRPDFDVENVTRVVLDVLAERVSLGEARHLREVLPKELRSLLVEA